MTTSHVPGPSGTIIWLLTIWTQYGGITSQVLVDPYAKSEIVNPDDLLLVQVVHRHGERTAIYDIPTAGQKPQTIRDGFPKEAILTPRGVADMYEYGRYMRHRYHKFFDDGKPISSQRIRVISSSTDRTITSAEALMAGLLPPEDRGRIWNSSLGNQWVPFPVYARPSVHDTLLLNFKDDCPVFSEFRKNISDIPMAKQFQATMPGFAERMKAATGLTTYAFFDTSTTIEDAVHYAQSNSVNGSVDQGTLPYWYNESIGEDLRRIADFRMHLVVGGNGDRRRTRFKTGVLLYEIFERMNLSRSLGGKLPLKMVLYSGHDENVAGILAALDSFNYTIEGPNIGIPDFTASVIFELYKNSSVRLLFKNNLSDMWSDPLVVKHPQCLMEYCPLDKLYDLVKDVATAEDQWLQECGATYRVRSNMAKTTSADTVLPSKLQLNEVPPPPVSVFTQNGSGVGIGDGLVIGGVLIAASLIFAALVAVCIARMRRRAPKDRVTSLELSNGVNR